MKNVIRLDNSNFMDDYKTHFLFVVGGVHDLKLSSYDLSEFLPFHISNPRKFLYYSDGTLITYDDRGFVDQQFSDISLSMLRNIIEN